MTQEAPKEYVGRINVRMLVEVMLMMELLIEKYNTNGLFDYMVEQIRPDILMIVDGIEVLDVMPLLDKKFENPLHFSLKQAMMQLQQKGSIS